MYLPTFLLLFTSNVQSANILGMFLYPSISHQVVYQQIMKELSLRGHQVTVITPDVLNDATLTNLTEVHVRSAYEVFKNRNVQKMYSKNLDYFLILRNLHNFLDIIAEHELNDASVRQFFADEKKIFDVVLIDLLHPVLFALGEKYQAPVVGVRSMSILGPQYDAVGNPQHPVAHPDNFIPFPPNAMTMWEKLQCLYYSLCFNYYYHRIFLPRADVISAKYFGDGGTIAKYEKNASLYFVKRNFMLQRPKPNVPAVVEVLPLQFQQANALPPDLQQILDESTEGVIYASFGSNIKSTCLDENLRNSILQAVSELPYVVLWKWESDHFPNKPKNVIIRKWFPQRDLLAHPNIKAFLTHGGLKSLEEAIMAQVPLISIPLYGDQLRNTLIFVELGIGERIDDADVTSVKLKNTIIQVATNASHKDNLRRLSAILFDKPSLGLDSIVWWTEYVIRHKGAKHLRSPAITMSWFEYLMLDVLLVFSVVAVLSVLILSKLVLLTCKQIF